MEPPPLGFTDLTQDEALLITIFRGWARDALETTEFEDATRDLFQNDRIRPALDDLFQVFHNFRERRGGIEISEEGVLSAAELQLLTVLDDSEDGLADCAAHACCSRLTELAMRPRRTSTIPRSGQDDLEAKIARSYRWALP
ncbi:MAG: hypothetical protein AAGE52_29570 [Myxococcota bacterium]